MGKQLATNSSDTGQSIVMFERQLACRYFRPTGAGVRSPARASVPPVGARYTIIQHLLFSWLFVAETFNAVDTIAGGIIPLLDDRLLAANYL
jgi:hypothetical protein